MNSPTGRAGLIRARDDAGNVDKLAHAVLDDVLYNVISDLLMKAHREEKTAKANTAAIQVEKLALSASDNPTSDSKPDVRVETDAAVYEDGKVFLKGNPLQTTHTPRPQYCTGQRQKLPLALAESLNVQFTVEATGPFHN
ncbi:helix-turn-helix domain-containing protein [Ophiocordyceps sinensis CO18]|uniref:Helix-turn-helix domain-containing protein n=1 Tax=Ophiocordyceps sinensis (strain Co18 / CGMCC 3.14243) TaxID=911162 RepID=T5A4T6_OPHSC|nr:helix-turn-helix domain-containing protein [Ophiocordyceps sinensis CO18]